MATAKVGKGKTVLITGSSSGIGEALATCFAKGGFDLVLVARNEAKLKLLADILSATHDISAVVASADLSLPGSAEVLAAKMKRDKHEIDVLVNCAGVLEHGQFVEMPGKRHQEMIDLNISGLTAMLAYFLPPMVVRGHGRILNVASIAGFQPIPSLATYAATKAYVLSLTESLSEELKNTGVTVSALCPGITATNMMSGAQKSSPGLKLPGFLVGDAEKVAAEGYRACLRGDVIRVPGVLNLATILASRATPKWLLRRVSGTVGRATVKK